MTKEELTKAIENTLSKTMVGKLSLLASRNKNCVSDLIEITFDPDQKVAFRAAWILENVFNSSFATFRPHIELFLACYSKQKNQSCRRHYTKIMMELAKQPTLKAAHHEGFLLVIETSFNWLIDEKTPVAVKVNCLDILAELKDMDDWILPELKEQISFLLIHGSAAMQSRGKKLLKRLSAV